MSPGATGVAVTTDASTTAVESLLRTLDESAHWENRTASRVRAFAAARSGDATILDFPGTRCHADDSNVG